jgi:hypothetical protein
MWASVFVIGVRRWKVMRRQGVRCVTMSIGVGSLGVSEVVVSLRAAHPVLLLRYTVAGV